jgi:hypothetical protein
VQEGGESREFVEIEEDCKKHKKQYNKKYQPFLSQIWAKRARTLWNEQESTVFIAYKSLPTQA